MSELVANYSGAGRVITSGYNSGTDRKWPTLNDEVKNEVLFGNMANKFAWYVDYFTSVKTAGQFSIRFISQDPLIRWTNEAKDQRDPKDPINGMWQPDDVAAWFKEEIDDTPTGHSVAHLVKFSTADGLEHTLTLAAFECDIDGDSTGVWERYCEDGVRGALEPFLSTFGALVGIEVRRI